MTPTRPLEATGVPSWLTGFTLTRPPAGFVDDPYPFYAALRAHAPVHRLGPDSVLLTRHEDVIAVYRDPKASSDKQREFTPKFGDGSPLFEHHTTSLVFNDAPLHTRVRRLLMGALNQRAIARMEPGLVTLVDGLLDQIDSDQFDRGTLLSQEIDKKSKTRSNYDEIPVKKINITKST